MEQNMMDTIARISGVNPRKCMRCGKCTASCPAFDEMEYHPHQFVSMVENGRIDELLASRGIYTCLSCFACVERCPRNVEPAKLIEAVRLAVIRKQGGPDCGGVRLPLANLVPADEAVVDESAAMIAAAISKYC